MKIFYYYNSPSLKSNFDLEIYLDQIDALGLDDDFGLLRSVLITSVTP